MSGSEEDFTIMCAFSLGFSAALKAAGVEDVPTDAVNDLVLDVAAGRTTLWPTEDEITAQLRVTPRQRETLSTGLPAFLAARRVIAERLYPLLTKEKVREEPLTRGGMKL